MAMPTEERRVVKKVVIQPDGTKKVIKKIIRVVPKNNWWEVPTPAENSNPLAEESPITWEDVSPILDSGDTSINEEENSNQIQETMPSEGVFNENITTENQSNNEPVQDVLPATQPESQETLNSDTQEPNTIDLWNLNFAPEAQTQVEEPVATQENAAPIENGGAPATLNMDSLLESSPTEEPAQNEVQAAETPVIFENPTTAEAPASLNLDQMISQPEQTVAPVEQTADPVEQPVNAENETQTQESWESFDPFMAMKTNLEQVAAEEQQTLDLNAIAWQSGTEQSTWAPMSDTPTLDLSAIPSQILANPMTSNVLNSLWGVTADPKKKKIVTIAASCFGILILAAIVFIRYPDMFSWGLEHGSAPVDITNPDNWGTVDNNPTDQQPIQWQTWDDWNNQNTQDNQEIKIETRDDEIIKPKDPVVIWGNDFFDDDKEIATVILDEVSIGWTTSGGSVDPLGEVSGLIWPINGNDTIIQEALEYEGKGKALKDKWASEHNRNKMRYWTFVEGRARETIDALEKGENIDISSWISQKTQFDEYLEKGNNA